ncbi:hypothetical protein TrispH2_004302 [Trichoplax sp. H2]|uniref:RNA-binding S4 domain-containing protein n=1 Tax=Trichoplax adhaerens TaxID=10228 RepID=B3RX58_TRIAD|nr:hypothetical protein TRIADDRAFT_57005 [Trichoplax adhaerens]EDV24814.1 hypothetical protein TRIADDRAFT_57005 [Trichoplax adhaerens]RDD43617.1 hypothetical protein TrispH2_004302 [Trichoplax sp. H2]|eukprot:XP_002112704.1 hypothetical protein TRIADDRAFT_57005 [Trichoplax adhaerens]
MAASKSILQPIASLFRSQRRLWTNLVFNKPRLRYSSNKADDPTFKEIDTVTTSLRIDAIASKGLGISRRKLWEYCLRGYVSVNGIKIKKKSAEVKNRDKVIIDGPGINRGYVEVIEIGNLTKKGNYHIRLKRCKRLLKGNELGL